MLYTTAFGLALSIVEISLHQTMPFDIEFTKSNISGKDAALNMYDRTICLFYGFSNLRMKCLGFPVTKDWSTVLMCVQQFHADVIWKPSICKSNLAGEIKAQLSCTTNLF